MKYKLNEIYASDCLSFMKQVPGESIDLIVTDPPHNIGMNYGTLVNDNLSVEQLENFTYKWGSECYRVLKPTGSLYIIFGWQFSDVVRMVFRKLPFIMRRNVIWYFTFGRYTDHNYSNCHYDVLYYVKSNMFTFNKDDIRVISARQLAGDKRHNPLGKVPDDVWGYPRLVWNAKEREQGHPCQTQPQVVERAILASSNLDDLVFDPFVGSGVVPCVAKRLGRQFLGCEINPEYIAIAKSRIKNKL